MSRRAFSPTGEQRRTVEAMTAYGIRQTDIARVVGIDDETLRKHFREEIDTGAAKATARVAEFLFQQATGQRGDGSAAVTAAIFWMKTRGRWKETVVNEHTGADGGAIELDIAERQNRVRAILDEVFGDGSGGAAPAPEGAL